MSFDWFHSWNVTFEHLTTTNKLTRKENGEKIILIISTIPKRCQLADHLISGAKLCLKMQHNDATDVKYLLENVIEIEFQPKSIENL